MVEVSLPFRLVATRFLSGSAVSLRAPSKTVTARPVSVTRSPCSSTPTKPERDETWKPVSSVRPSRSAQYGARTVCALPVTGSSGMPACGAKTRDTKSYGSPSAAGAVGIRPTEESSTLTASRSGRSARTESSSASSASRNAPFAVRPGPFHGRTECVRYGVSRCSTSAQGQTGKSIASEPSGLRSTARMPLRVANRIGPATPSSNRQWAEASVA